MFLNICKTLKIQVEEVFLSFKDFLKPQGIQRKEENNYAWERPWNIFFSFSIFPILSRGENKQGRRNAVHKGKKSQDPEA